MDHRLWCGHARERALLARCGWGGVPEDDANSMLSAVGLENNRSSIYGIAVESE
jgi:hypothetical protein